MTEQNHVISIMDKIGIDIQPSVRPIGADQRPSQTGDSRQFEAALARIRDRADARQADADASAEQELLRKSDALRAQIVAASESSQTDTANEALTVEELDSPSVSMQDEPAPGAQGSVDDTGSEPDVRLPGNDSNTGSDVSEPIAAQRDASAVAPAAAARADLVLEPMNAASAALDSSFRVSDVSAAQTEAALSVSAVQDAPIGSASEIPRSTGSNLNGSLDAENVSLLMNRLDRTADTHEGQWRFGVLNDDTGVTGLHLQRNEQGSWQVNVSMNNSSLHDTESRVEELMSALEDSGHSIDSIMFTQDPMTSMALDD